MRTPSDDEPLAPERLLLHPLWIGALGVMVLNDHVLKATDLAPVVTGKLSDFAGLLVAPVLLAALLRARRRRTAWLGAAAIGAVFAAINVSPAAAEVWDGAMAAVGFPWHTTTDPTDLVALAVLPVAVHWIPRGSATLAGPGRRQLQLAVAAVAGIACLATSPPPTEPIPFESEARVTLLNETHELQAFRVSYLADDVEVDCDRVAEAPEQYLREDAFGEQTRWILFSGQQIGLGVEGARGRNGPRRFDDAGFADAGNTSSVGSDDCRAARVAVETAPDIVVFWDNSLEPKTFRRNSQGSKDSLGGPQTVALTGDYEDVADDQMHPFRYRPCEDDDICGRDEERQAAAEIPEGAEYRWDRQSGSGLFFEIPDRTERAENDRPEQCRLALERAGIDWEEFPADFLEISRVERGDDGCHELVFTEPGDGDGADGSEPASRLVCAPFTALRHLRTGEGESLQVSLREVGRVPDEARFGRYVGLRLDVQSDATGDDPLGQIWLTRGTRLPDVADADVETRPMASCGPAETRCGQVEVPARLELSSDEGETAELLPGEYATFTDGERREIHVASASERPVARPAGACGETATEVEEILGGRPLPYFEVATTVGFEGDG